MLHVKQASICCSSNCMGYILSTVNIISLQYFCLNFWKQNTVSLVSWFAHSIPSQLQFEFLWVRENSSFWLSKIRKCVLKTYTNANYEKLDFYNQTFNNSEKTAFVGNVEILFTQAKLLNCSLFLHLDALCFIPSPLLRWRVLNPMLLAT
jgi:hypothetical protein